MSYSVRRLENIRAEVPIPPDKSISHRAVILSAIAQGETKISNFLNSDDTKATLDCLKRLGVKIKQKAGEAIIKGRGKFFPQPEKEPLSLNANESGTTMRILSGLLCAQKFSIKFTGAASLNRRPMARIIEPLRKMGANISGKDNYPPLFISSPLGGIKSIDYTLPVASAQVKSAIMLAALYADKPATIREPYQSRDHTERMLKLFKVKVEVSPVRNSISNGVKVKHIVCYPPTELTSPKELFIPADFSSAAFFMVLGLIVKNSKILLKGVNINPTRCGLLAVLKRMGAKIKLTNRREAFEPYADIAVESSALKATTVSPEEIPLMIDEIPILGVAAAFAKGVTVIKGIGELQLKESDRVEAIHSMLRAAGIVTRPFSASGIEIRGIEAIHVGARHWRAPIIFDSFSDHRIAMSAIVLGSRLGGSTIDDIGCINKSFPQFVSLINQLPSG